MAYRSGILKIFDSGAYTATVQMSGSLSAWFRDLPVSRGIASGEMTAGRRVAVLLFDDANPRDCVLLAVWS